MVGTIGEPDSFNMLNTSYFVSVSSCGSILCWYIHFLKIHRAALLHNRMEPMVHYLIKCLLVHYISTHS
jgi:hypothetical protein